MSSVVEQPAQNVRDYVTRLCNAEPTTALQIALAESQRIQAQATKAQEEYRMLAEVEFDGNGMIVKANMAGLWRLAQSYSRSEIVPEQYRGKPDDCFIAIQMAQRLRVDTFNFMQNAYVVYGKPGIEAKLAMAILNTSGRIKGRIRWTHTGSGEDRACTATVTDAATGLELSEAITWKMAVDEGWVSKKGSKWGTMPKMMFQYRSASFLIRMYYSEILMGMSFRDEIEDTVIDVESEPKKAPARSLDALMEQTGKPKSIADEMKTVESEIETVVKQDAGTGEPPSLESLLQAEFDKLTDRQRRNWYDKHCGEQATCDVETANIASNIYDEWEKTRGAK